MVVFYFFIAFIAVYTIRVAIYLVWLYFETEKTIKHARKFESKSSDSKCDVLFIGDSLTYGVGASSPDKSIAGLFESENQNCSVYNNSVNKITTYNLFNIMNEFDKTSTTYQIAVLSIGGNDIVQLRSMRGLEKRIKHIVNKLSAVSENVYIYTPTKPGRSPLLIKLIIYNRVKKLRTIVQSLESDNVHHVDMWQEGDKLLENPKKYFVKDTLHLSDAGQFAWYEQLKKTIKR